MEQILLVLFFLLGVTGEVKAQENKIEHVVIISVDGLRPDAISRVETPVLDRWMREGTVAVEARTIFPSITLPSHTSMLTGLSPIRHGVFFNSRRKGMEFIKATTCLEIAARSGRRVAFVVSKDKLLHLARGVEGADCVPKDADRVAERACEVVRKQKPNLMFVHFKDPDSVGHRWGWMGDKQLKAIETVDRALGQLDRAITETQIRDRTVIILTADHGGHGRIHGTLLKEDMLIPWICVGRSVESGQRVRRRIHTYDTAATALYLLGIEVPQAWQGRPVVEVTKRK